MASKIRLRVNHRKAKPKVAIKKQQDRERVPPPKKRRK